MADYAYMPFATQTHGNLQSPSQLVDSTRQFVVTIDIIDLPSPDLVPLLALLPVTSLSLCRVKREAATPFSLSPYLPPRCSKL